MNGELQGLNKDDHFGKRVEYHVAHFLNHYVTKGMEWHELPQAFQVSVLNFYFDKDEAESVNHYCLRNEKGHTISGTLNVIFMELPKIARLSDDISLLIPAQMWGNFFLYASVLKKQDYIRELAKHNRGINMAVTVLKNISQEEMNWYHETRYWMHVSDERTMKHAAWERGQRDKAIESAKNFLKMNILTVEQIAQGTGLSVAEVQELAAQL